MRPHEFTQIIIRIINGFNAPHLKINKRTLAFLALGLFLLSDRFLKALAENLAYQETNLVKNFLHFGFYPNQNLFFLIKLPSFLSFAFMLAALVLFVIYFLEQKKQDQLPFYFILFGGLNNFYDRAFKGAVIDFLNLFNLATFNLADVLIIVGLLLIVLPVIKKPSSNFGNWKLEIGNF